jgi:mono/diheme cytochrome c family protein
MTTQQLPGRLRIASLSLAFGLLAGAVWAQDAEPDATVGEALYQRNCAACHGAEATGNGPLAPVLTLQPTDLTALSARNSGTFPLLRVIARIDGQDPLVAHGSPMPVFGPYFESAQHVALKADTGQPVIVSAPIGDLVAWLQSVQK